MPGRQPTVIALAHAASRRDAWIALGGGLLLIFWDLSGLDLELTRSIATTQGFAWRDSLLASQLLHDGGRVLAWILFLCLLCDAAKPFVAGPSRGERLRALGVVLSGLLCVPLLKRFSQTSCPWDLAEFGGRATYVSHWWFGHTDGGPGHCFPSGHAVAAFAFLGVYFLWRHHTPRAARVMLALTLAVGLAYSWAQWVRGAHWASHSAWSAWLCWVIGAVAARIWPVRPVQPVEQGQVQTSPH